MKKILINENRFKPSPTISWASFVKKDDGIQLESKELWPAISEKSTCSGAKEKEKSQSKIPEKIEDKIKLGQNCASSENTATEPIKDPSKPVEANVKVKQTDKSSKKSNEIIKNQHIQMIDESIMLKYQQSKALTIIDKLKKNKKFKRINHDSDNILNFVRKPSSNLKQKGNLERRTVESSIIRNKGKRREIAKKRYSRLKKEILKSREKNKEIVSAEVKQTTETEELEIKVQQLQLEEKKKTALKHSRNFRDYCDHFITDEIRNYSKTILSDLFRFNDRAFKKNKVKAKANQRYIVGFSEVTKYLEANKLKLIIISPDLEPNQPSIDAAVDEIKSLCIQNQVPYIFSIKRRQVGFLLLKKVPISCVGIFNYDGTDGNVKKLLELVEIERKKYKELADEC